MTHRIALRFSAAVLSVATFAILAWQSYGPVPAAANAPPRAALTAFAVAVPVFALPDLTLAAPPDLPERLTEDPAAAGPMTLPEDGSRFGLPCGFLLTAEARPAAMIALRIEDPCRPNAALHIEHSGLVFTLDTGLMGSAEILLPAMTDPAAIRVHMPDGAVRTAQVAVPDLADFDRFAVVWQGAGGLQLHARERGADYGARGHVWPGRPGTVAQAIRGTGGFLTALGTGIDADAWRAQIYSFPRDALGTGTVRLTLEVAIGSGNCGHDTRAETLQRHPDGRVGRVTLDFTVPGCAATGEYMVLQNLFRDLRIAAN